MTRYRVLPYKQGSRSAKALATALGGKVLKLEGSTFKSRPGDVIINWGNSNYPDFLYSTNINCVPLSSAANKLNFFNLMKETENHELIPQFWTDQASIPDEAFPVVCRTILSGHSGAGIHIAATRADLVVAPLYVGYIKKKEEYRVHVGQLPDGTYRTIAVQRKARRLSTPDSEVNWKVRNLAGGFVYTRTGFDVPDSVEVAAHNCLRATSLDFAAVDVIWREHDQRPYVLEVNTAPGLEGQTVNDYADFFRAME
jgi:hypothetical protein